VCGIAGIFRFDGLAIDQNDLKNAVKCLHKRGPNAKGIFSDHYIGLCHTRLAIIDLDPASNQPFHDETERYVLVYNGEIFNYKTLAKDLEKEGVVFHTKSDTEVLLQMLINEGKDCLSKLNGFFSFAFYDRQTHELLLARDRYGVKPLYVYHDNEKVIFGSEIKSLIALGIPKKMDHNSLLFYFQLNYIPAPLSIFEGLEKLLPSSWYHVTPSNQPTTGSFYEIKIQGKSTSNYEENKATLKHLLTQSVHDRLVSDVPIGVFLSGGVDSSIVALLAQRLSKGIHSFSIGFKDNRFYDESVYAEKVAEHIGTHHHTFYLDNEEMLGNLDEMLAYMDEPFADSSAIAVYNLCKQTRKHATVVLTGDGADEVFGGYNKHLAEWKIRKANLVNKTLGLASPLLSYLPESRGTLWGNEFRKVKKYARSIALSESERYWQWCSFSSEKDARALFSATTWKEIDQARYQKEKKDKLHYFQQSNSLDAVFASDVSLVLEGDMLVKTDRMSMAHSIELRNPFLDYRVVDFAFQLQHSDKIAHNTAKRILKDTFRPYLPFEVFARPKHGFEVPLKDWFQKELKDRIENDWLSDKFIQEQGIFDLTTIQKLKKQLFSLQPQDVPQRIWGLIVFQQWWKAYMH